MNKFFLEKLFSAKRIERYMLAHHNDESKAVLHYQSNIELAESFYPSLSIFEVALRNAISRELTTMTGRNDWYSVFPTTPGLTNLQKYITDANRHIAMRHESATPDKIIAELTLGFWVSLFNSEYELILWQALRRAFPYMPKTDRKRKNVSAPLNTFRTFRNRIFHNESICWNLNRVNEIHNCMMDMAGWIDKELPRYIEAIDRYHEVQRSIRERMGW